jgi:hypothetical protein
MGSLLRIISFGGRRDVEKLDAKMPCRPRGQALSTGKCRPVVNADALMMPEIKRFILRLLDEHRVMTLATNRPDGWPQATMVGYVNDGFLQYCFVARNA